MFHLKRALSTVPSAKVLPRLVVFDLDHTVWPFGIDRLHLVPPYHYDQHNRVVDVHNQEIKHFPDVLPVLNHLHTNNIKIAVATRTKYPTGALELLQRFGLDKYVHYIEISAGSKVYHFNRIRNDSGVAFHDMMFFDDEERNIVDIAPLGVHAVLVSPETGITKAVFDQELLKFADRAEKKSKQ